MFRLPLLSSFVYSLFVIRRPGRQVSWQWSVCGSSWSEIGNHLPPAAARSWPNLTQSTDQTQVYKVKRLDADERALLAL